MAIKSKWNVRIEALRLKMRVGLHAREKRLQPVQLTLKISTMSATSPGSIDHCVDYDPLVQWLTEALPAMPHTELLETRVNEIARFVFSRDKRILGLWIGLYKEKAFPDLPLIGVEREMTRRQYEELNRGARPAPKKQLAVPTPRRKPVP